MDSRIIMSIMRSIVLISILLKISTASVSYHVVQSDTPSQQMSWDNIKVKVTNRFASCRNNEEYNKLVLFLKTLDNDIEFFVGIKIVNQEFKTADGHHTIVVTTAMAKLDTLAPQPGKTYYLHWKKDVFVMSENNNDAIVAAQGIQEYRNSVLTTFKYFAWITAEDAGGITLKDTVLGLQAHGPDSNSFDLLTANGSPKTVIVSATDERCFVTFEDAEKNKIKQNVEEIGYSSNLIKVTGKATIPGEQTGGCCGYFKTDHTVVKDVVMWVRPVDENKKILFLGATGSVEAQIAKKVYGEFDKFSQHFWNNVATHSNNHEYVFNLFKFKFVSQIDFVTDVDDIYDDDLKPHKGLVIINKEPLWLKNEYYKKSDNKYNEFIHSRNLQRFFRPTEKVFWQPFGVAKANIETWRTQSGSGHRVLNVVDLFTSKTDFLHPRKFYAYNFQMSQTDLQSKYSGGNIKLKQFSDVNPTGNNLNNNAQPIIPHKELLVYPSGHTGDSTMAEDIDSTMKKKQPKTVIIEIDSFRLSTYPNNDFDETGGSNLDMIQAIRTAIHNTFTKTIVYADTPALTYFAWMFQTSPMHRTAFGGASQDIFPVGDHYHLIDLNVRNHLMMHVILKAMDQNPTWIQIGANHYEKHVQPTNNYPYQMLHLLTNEYNSLSIPLRFTSDGKISLRYDIKPYHQLEHTFRAKRPFNNDYYIEQKNEHAFTNHFVSPYMLQLVSLLAVLVCLVLIGIACVCIVAFILVYKNVYSIKSTIDYQNSYSL